MAYHQAATITSKDSLFMSLPVAFRNIDATMGFTLQHIQTIYSSLGIPELKSGSLIGTSA